MLHCSKIIWLKQKNITFLTKKTFRKTAFNRQFWKWLISRNNYRNVFKQIYNSVHTAKELMVRNNLLCKTLDIMPRHTAKLHWGDWPRGLWESKDDIGQQIYFWIYLYLYNTIQCKIQAPNLNIKCLKKLIKQRWRRINWTPIIK